MSRIRHAAALARHGNFGRAAIELNISQSTLSRSIQTLELQLDLALFERTAMGTVPTPAGKLFLRKAQDMIAAVDDLEDAMRRAWRHSGATIRIGFGPMPALLLLPALCRRQIGESPIQRLMCQVQTGMRLRELVEADELDLAVCAEGSIELRGNLRAEHLFDIPTTIRVRRGHPLLAKAILSADDLARYPLVGAYLDSRMIQELAPRSLLYNPIIASDDLRMLADLVADSDAYCIFPDAMETPALVDLAAGRALVPRSVPIVAIWAGENKPPEIATLQHVAADVIWSQ
jgi:DNA-binding transcriptional LysR family regulator